MNASVPLTLNIRSERALYRAYMPFIRNGGLFVPTERSHELGDEVSVVLALMGADEPVSVSGKVIWVTPNRAQGKRAAGIGVQFDDDGTHRRDIEEQLTGFPGSEVFTHTL